MPALKNVKWERFCQAIVNGVAKQGEKFSQGKAYVSAGFNAKDVGKPGGSAEVCASKLLNRAKIESRIAELLHEAQNKATTKRAYAIETISERMALASRIAEEDRNPSALYGAEKAIAEVRDIIVAHHARSDVSAAAGREWHDQTHRPCRISLRSSDARDSWQRRLPDARTYGGEVSCGTPLPLPSYVRCAGRYGSFPSLQHVRQLGDV